MTTTATTTMTDNVFVLDNENNDDPGFSRGQYIALVMALFTSGTLSMLGSSFIIRMAYSSLLKSNKSHNNSSNNNKNQVVSNNYNRLLIGLSCGDLFFSTFIILNPILVPSEYSSHNLVAIGNTATCTAAGFLMLSGAMVVAIYNCGLSFHFLFRVRYNRYWRPDDIVHKWERPIHFIAWTIPFAVGTFALINQVYNPHFHLCVFNDYPSGCADEGSEIECERGENDETAGKIFAILTGVASISGVIATVLVYLSVKRQLNRNRRYAFTQTTSSGLVGTTATTTTTTRVEEQEAAGPAKIATTMTIADSSTVSMSATVGTRADKTCQVVQTISSCCSDREEGAPPKSSLQQDNNNNTSNTSNYTADEEENASSRANTNTLSSSSSSSHDLSREVGIQAVLYTVAYLNSFIWPIIVSVVYDNIGATELDQRQGDPDLFAISLFMGMLYPLQGFWNLFIFIRPRRNAWLRATTTTTGASSAGGDDDDKLSTCTILRKILASEPIPRPAAASSSRMGRITSGGSGAPGGSSRTAAGGLVGSGASLSGSSRRGAAAGGTRPQTQSIDNTSTATSAAMTTTIPEEEEETGVIGGK